MSCVSSQIEFVGVNHPHTLCKTVHENIKNKSHIFHGKLKQEKTIGSPCFYLCALKY